MGHFSIKWKSLKTEINETVKYCSVNNYCKQKSVDIHSGFALAPYFYVQNTMSHKKRNGYKHTIGSFRNKQSHFWKNVYKGGTKNCICALSLLFVFVFNIVRAMGYNNCLSAEPQSKMFFFLLQCLFFIKCYTKGVKEIHRFISIANSFHTNRSQRKHKR